MKKRRRLVVLGLSAVLVALAAAAGVFGPAEAPDPVVPREPAPPATGEPGDNTTPDAGAARATVLGPVEMSARIDEWVEGRLRAVGVPPAPVADDAEFFRRLSLDLTGRIPTAAQLRDFLDDDRPDKRHLWASELIDGPEYAPAFAAHFTNVWRRILMPDSPALAGALDAWLAERVRVNSPYDQFVRQLLTDSGADGFYQTAEKKPEVLAARTARLFLGVRLDCVQCHDDRSGGSRKQTQFWEFAAFFAPREAGPARIRARSDGPWTEAKYLDGTRPGWDDRPPPAVLAEWITRPDNPWFARAAVNRMWTQFFGTGLVDPIDGFGSDGNPPSHPELLDDLARGFTAQGFDLRNLVLGLVGSRAYQRTSRQTHPGQRDPHLFARAHPRPLSPEQVFDSLRVATGARLARTSSTDAVAFRADTPQARFHDQFEDTFASGRASVQQALMMMNGEVIDELLRPENSPTIAALGGTRSTARLVEELYLVVLSRSPGSAEAARAVRFLDAGDRDRNLRDLVWVLLNTPEFIQTH